MPLVNDVQSRVNQTEVHEIVVPRSVEGIQMLGSAAT